MANIQRLNHRHEQIINWLLANPDRNLGECAQSFGYTQAWLSQIIHSDMFQAVYQERAKELGVMVVHSLGAKLKATADIALDKIQERLTAPMPCSDSFLTDSSKNILSALGYIGGKGQAPASEAGANHFHQHIHVDAQTLVQARERARALVAPVDGQSFCNVKPDLLPASAGTGEAEGETAAPLHLSLPAETGQEALLESFH